jgi:hypothetical protein
MSCNFEEGEWEHVAGAPSLGSFSRFYVMGCNRSVHGTMLGIESSLVKAF